MWNIYLLIYIFIGDFIKKIISSKFLSKSNQFNFYKNNYEEVEKENKNLKNQFRLIEEQNRILNKKIDSYSKIISDIKESYIDNPKRINSDRQKILFVLHSGSGGTPKTVNDIVKNIYNEFDCYLLTSDNNLMKLSFYDGNAFKEIEHDELYCEWLCENTYIEEYSNIYFKYLIKYSFDIVHIHHLIFHTFDLPKLCYELGIPVILSVHDLYFICPSYTLMDADLKYCEGVCENSKSEENCFLPMANITNIKSLKTFVCEWRKLVKEMFSYIDCFVMPSMFIRDIIQKNYSLSENRINIIAHGIDYNEPEEDMYEVPNRNKPTKILFLGNLYPQKGVSIIKKLSEVDDDENLEFHFLGFAPSELSEIGVHHGTYENNQLSEHIKQIKPSFIGIFTLCGESYCYTLSESWALKIPVLVSKLGALKERVIENGGGWFIDVNNMKDTYDKILSIIDDTEEYCSKQSEIENIRLFSTRFMSEKYLEIYDNFITE